jgi:hypothetical protein
MMPFSEPYLFLGVIIENSYINGAQNAGSHRESPLLLGWSIAPTPTGTKLQR